MSGDEQDIGSIMARGAAEAERAADMLDPGVKHKLIDAAELIRTHRDMEKIKEAIHTLRHEAGLSEKEIQGLHPNSVHSFRFQGQPGKIMILRVPDRNPVCFPTRFSGFSDKVVIRLKLDRKLFDGDWKAQADFSRHHEFAHWINTDRPKGISEEGRLGCAHRSEMFADVLTVLNDLKVNGEKNVSTWKTFAQCRWVQSLNLDDGDVDFTDEECRSSVAHITSRGIYGALSRAAADKDFCKRSLKELRAMAANITFECAFTGRELIDIYKNIKEANHLLARSAPRNERDRMRHALDIGALNPATPWVREMAAAWQELTGGQSIVLPRRVASKKHDTHAAQVQRRSSAADNHHHSGRS